MFTRFNNSVMTPMINGVYLLIHLIKIIKQLGLNHDFHLQVICAINCHKTPLTISLDLDLKVNSSLQIIL